MSSYLKSILIGFCLLFIALFPAITTIGNVSEKKVKLLVKLKDDRYINDFAQKNNLNRIGQLDKLNIHIIELSDESESNSVIDSLKAQDNVEFVERDDLVKVDILPNDPLYPSQYQLPRINSSDAWQITTGNSSVVVAILDTGVNSIPELSNKLVTGWNFFDNNADTSDVYGHGSAVAGTAAAQGNNNLGVASVCWNCSIMPIRVSDTQGYASFSTIANALTWAADNGAKVANISFRVTTSFAITQAANYFYNRGGVVTISAGNDGSFDGSADNPYVLTVGATDNNDVIYSWSCFGNNQDLVAPGVVYTTSRDGGYVYASGTSFSAPLVAGAAGLIYSVNPNLTAQQVQDFIKQNANDLGSTGWDIYYGYGRLNVGRAVIAASGGILPPPPPPSIIDTTAPVCSIVSPNNGDIVSKNISITANATDNVGVVKVEFYIDGILTDTINTAPYTSRWNTRRYRSGTHILQCKAYDIANNVGSSSLVGITVK